MSPNQVHQGKLIIAIIEAENTEVVVQLGVVQGMIPGEELPGQRDGSQHGTPIPPSEVPDHERTAVEQPGFEQVEVLLGGVELVPLLEHRRVETQPALGPCPVHAGKAGRPQQEVQPLQVGMRSDLRALEFRLRARGRLRCGSSSGMHAIGSRWYFLPT